jgi:hypothetical protein
MNSITVGSDHLLCLAAPAMIAGVEILTGFGGHAV